MEKIFGIEDGRYRANNPRDKFFILCIHGEKKKVSSHHHEIFSFGERSAFFRTFVRADTWNDDFPPILIPDQRIQRRLKNKGERERESRRNCGSICRANDHQRSILLRPFDPFSPLLPPFFSRSTRSLSAGFAVLLRSGDSILYSGEQIAR